MIQLVFVVFLILNAGLSASDSPILARPAAALPEGSFGVEAGVRQFNHAFWLDSHGELAGSNGSYWMPDSDGLTKSVKGFQFDFRFLWSASRRHLIEISLPYYNHEFSQARSNPWQPSALGDSTVRSADASGDLALGWRGLAMGSPEGTLKAGLGLELSVPTGQGPFASAHPLVATGNGGFVASALLNLAADGEVFRAWLQAHSPYEFGYSADIAPGAFVAYRVNQPPRTLAGGRSWVSRSFSYDLIMGLAWNWHVREAAAHSLALELQFEEKGAMRLDGVEVPDSVSRALNVLPEARFSFGKAIAVNFGWLAPLGYASNRAVSYWGDLLLRVDYKL